MHKRQKKYIDMNWLCVIEQLKPKQRGCFTLIQYVGMTPLRLYNPSKKVAWIHACMHTYIHSHIQTNQNEMLGLKLNFTIKYNTKQNLSLQYKSTIYSEPSASSSTPPATAGTATAAGAPPPPAAPLASIFSCNIT
jgi:hypothetical protein